LDFTRDAGRVEQMTIIRRYVDTETGCIEKYFVGLTALQETTADTLTGTILRELKSLSLDINDCRGHGYDNGANMGGVNSGVKSKILAISPTAILYSVWLSQLESAARRCRQIVKNVSPLFWLN
jgi:hypothetical protein